MARVTVEDCLEKVSDRFELVSIAALRAKALSSGIPSTVEPDNDKNAVIALREIAAKTLDTNHLKEQLISSLQTRNKVDKIDDENLHAEAQEAIDEEANYSAGNTDLFVDNTYSDLDTDQLFNDNVDDEDEKK